MSKVGKVLADFVIEREGACRACGLPAVLRNLLDVDHIDPADKIKYAGRPSACPVAKLQCLCRYCNNVKGAVDVPPLPIRAPEYDLAQVSKNQQKFADWVDTFRPNSARKVARLAKRVQKWMTMLMRFFFFAHFAVQALTCLALQRIDLLSLRQKMVHDGKTLQRMLLEAYNKNESASAFAERIALAYGPKK
jgi:hypothetical protein